MKSVIAFDENAYDKQLRIRTGGRDDSRSDVYRYPYEPTPYPVLERIVNSGWIRKSNCLLDYGCGKGRVSFYLAHQTRCRSIGVEYDDRIYEAACANRETCPVGSRVAFVNCPAEEFPVPTDVDRFFFFNPFSPELLKKVVARILDSYYEEPREMMLFFYFPSDEYVSYLMTVDEFNFEDEIDCSDLFEGNEDRERVLIFSIGYE